MKIEEIKQLTTEQLMQMSDKEFNKIFRQVKATARSRARRLLEHGYTNWTYTKYVEVEGPISPKRVKDKKNRAQLIAELKRGIAFISTESTTVKGYEKRVRIELEFRTGKKPLIYDKQFYRDFAKSETLYGKIKELNPELISTYGSENVRAAVSYVIQYFPEENDVSQIERVQARLETVNTEEKKKYEGLGFM